MKNSEPFVYTLPPLDFSPTLHVASCFCTFEGRLLLLRSAEHKAFGGTWSAPGGKLEPGETPLEGALRETWEETGMHLPPSSVHFFKSYYVRYPQFDFDYHVFSTQLNAAPLEIALQPLEHNAYLWTAPEEVLSMPLMPGALACLEELYGKPLKF